MQLVASGKQEELLDLIYNKYSKYKLNKQMTVIEGPGIMMGDTELDALVASSLETPVVLTLNGHAHMSASETFNHVVRNIFSGGRGRNENVCQPLLRWLGSWWWFKWA